MRGGPTSRQAAVASAGPAWAVVNAAISEAGLNTSAAPTESRYSAGSLGALLSRGVLGRAETTMPGARLSFGTSAAPPRELSGLPGPGSARDFYEDLWLDKLGALKAYVAEHGELPSTSHNTLGNWIRHQRTAYWAQINGKPCRSIMTPERISTLEAVLGWVWRVDLDEQWLEKLRELKAYVEQHGHLPSTRARTSHKTLGAWISNQRTAYWAQINGTPRTRAMTSERIAALEMVPGWVWRLDSDVFWWKKMIKLREHAEQHGGLQSSFPPKLAHWIMTQRSSYWAQKSGKPYLRVMAPERPVALEAVPGGPGAGQTIMTRGLPG